MTKRPSLLFSLMIIFSVACFFTQVLAVELPISKNIIPVVQVENPQETQDTIHVELRTLRDDLFAAWQKRDIDTLLTHVTPDAVVTWQNGDISRGHEGIRRFYQEMMGGKDSLISDVKSTLKLDELSVLYGQETAIAFGSIHDDISLNHAISRAPFLSDGKTLSLDSKWTATLVKMNNQWKLASYHVSTDTFSNPILAQAISVGKRIAILASIAGLVLGAIVMRLVIRRRINNTSIR